jgi:hypothetical protein
VVDCVVCADFGAARRVQRKAELFQLGVAIGSERGGAAAAEPMLARAGAIPRGSGWTFEPKLDGFRCLVCTHAGLRVRSRRGWDMTHLLPEFRRGLPLRVQLDGELVALDETGRPDFHRLSAWMLHGSTGIRVTYFVFDLLGVEGLATTAQPYLQRRALLDELVAENEQVRLVATFEDGEALFAAVCERGLEGVVAKRLCDPYRPGERLWVKMKNRATTRFEEEREGLGRRARFRRSLIRTAARGAMGSGRRGSPQKPRRRCHSPWRSLRRSGPERPARSGSFIALSGGGSLGCRRDRRRKTYPAAEPRARVCGGPRSGPPKSSHVVVELF